MYPEIICQDVKHEKVLISEEYGIVKIETAPSLNKTKHYINLIHEQITRQALSEIIRDFEVPKFHFGLRWGAISPENPNIPCMHQKDIVRIHQVDDSFRYAYCCKDQFGKKLPRMIQLKPIIDDIEANLGIDMSNYDVMIGNVYLENLYIPPHRDITESKAAFQYPIIVYTLGNNSGLGIWDGAYGQKISYNYHLNSFLYPDITKPTNEILTRNGTIYAMGYHGKKRFDLIHATPNNCKKMQAFPPIKLPNTDCISPLLRNKTITNYTITLTFRRAQDLSPDIPVSPKYFLE